MRRPLKMAGLYLITCGLRVLPELSVLVEGSDKFVPTYSRNQSSLAWLSFLAIILLPSRQISQNYLWLLILILTDLLSVCNRHTTILPSPKPSNLMRRLQRVQQSSQY